MIYSGQDYAFRQKDTVFDTLLVAGLFILNMALPVKIFRVPLALLLIQPPLLYLLFLEYNVLKLIKQYNRTDDGKYVSINTETGTLTVTQYGNTTTITSAEVRLVEVHTTKNLGKFGSFNYVAVITNADDKIILTNFTLPQTISERPLEKFLRGKKRVYFARTFNYIK